MLAKEEVETRYKKRSGKMREASILVKPRLLLLPNHSLNRSLNPVPFLLFISFHRNRTMAFYLV